MFFKRNKLSSTETVDLVETTVYEKLKPFGFKKYGRTLHRFVDSDISQVICFQNGAPSKAVVGFLSVNLGIRVPECAEHSFCEIEPLKKYYHEYDCNIRTSLGFLSDGKDTVYSLKKDPIKIGNDIVEKLEKYALPVFEALNSRDAILAHRREYPRFDRMNNHLILLEEAMIEGRRGNIPEATRLFNGYYRNALSDYNRDSALGRKIYLKKGQRMTYLNARTGKPETVTATKSGFETIYSANRVHLTYLEALANRLGIVLDPASTQ